MEVNRWALTSTTETFLCPCLPSRHRTEFPRGIHVGDVDSTWKFRSVPAGFNFETLIFVGDLNIRNHFNFQPFEGVSRGSETQLQMTENLKDRSSRG